MANKIAYPPVLSGRRVKSLWRRWRKPGRANALISPLTRKVLTVNMISLLLLLGGLLYTDQYRKSLVQAELQSLTMQARIFAGALGEIAVETIPEADATLLARPARDVIRRLVPPTRTRARLFDNSGKLIIDSRILGGRKGRLNSMVQIEELNQTTKPRNWFSIAVLEFLEKTGVRFSSWHNLPVYEERTMQTFADYEEVKDAMTGATAYEVRRVGDNDIILSVAVPVQHYRHVLGVLMVSKTGEDIEKTISEVQYTILKVFAGALLVTLLLSAYLASTLTRPILRLADAANRMRISKNRQISIPDYSARRDELGDLSSAIRDLTNALWNRMDAIERFAADVAHEIKNPLNSLRSAVETAVRLNDVQKQKQLLQIILDDVQRLDRLITDISEASRVDSDISKSNTGPVDIITLVAPLVESYNQQQRPRSIGVDLFVDPTKPIYVHGIASRLTQVIRNLIDNAISFSPKDGIVGVHVTDKIHSVEISVTDQGPGIPLDRQEKIFERFYTDRPQGEKFGIHSGLGLSISRQIIQAMGGSLTVHNIIDGEGKDAGACFTILLPSMRT